MWDWLSQHEELIWWLGVTSIVSFIGTLVAIPWVVVRIRADYFLHPEAPESSWRSRHPVIRFLILVVKNLLGGIFILAGIAMLVLPGQGILSILIGISLLNFPGKRALEFWLIRQPGVLKAVNWIRAKADRSPLEVNEQARSEMK
ncbi:MAG: hypothetical protein Tsb009_37720 [Planctomycetaceae bacterium]